MINNNCKTPFDDNDFNHGVGSLVNAADVTNNPVFLIVSIDAPSTSLPGLPR